MKRVDKVISAVIGHGELTRLGAAGTLGALTALTALLDEMVDYAIGRGVDVNAPLFSIDDMRTIVHNARATILEPR